MALSNPAIANPTFTSPADPTTLHFKVAVNDGYLTTVGTVTVNVVGSEAPVANAGPNQSVGRGQLVTLDGSASSDPDNDSITYAWTQVDGAGDPLDSGDPLYVSLSSATAQKPTFTSPTIVGAAQTMHFQLKVTDVPYGLVSEADTVDIIVNYNSAPTANAGAAQTNKFANALVTLNGSASSDPDAGDTLTYAWTQVDPADDSPLPPGPDLRDPLERDRREPDVHGPARGRLDDPQVPARRDRLLRRPECAGVHDRADQRQPGAGGRARPRSPRAPGRSAPPSPSPSRPRPPTPTVTRSPASPTSGSRPPAPLRQPAAPRAARSPTSR